MRTHDGKTTFAVIDGIFTFCKLCIAGQWAEGKSSQKTSQKNFSHFFSFDMCKQHIHFTPVWRKYLESSSVMIFNKKSYVVVQE